MHALGCLENTRKVRIVHETPRAKELSQAAFTLSNVRWGVTHLYMVIAEELDSLIRPNQPFKI